MNSASMGRRTLNVLRLGRLVFNKYESVNLSVVMDISWPPKVIFSNRILTLSYQLLNDYAFLSAVMPTD